MLKCNRRMWKLLLPISWLEILKLRNFSDSEVLKLRMQSFVSSGNSLKHSAKSAWFVFELFRLNCSLPIIAALFLTLLTEASNTYSVGPTRVLNVFLKRH